jgi:hypothetical protein
MLYWNMVLVLVDMRELLGCKDLIMTMVYTQVLNGGLAGVRSPADDFEVTQGGCYADQHNMP